jgi:IS5 family transposase
MTGMNVSRKPAPLDAIDMNQRSFASAEFALKKKRTRREKFLADMERVVPWARLIAIIEPLYPRSGRVGRPPIGVSKMLRMYCLQQWYGLADEALEDALYDSQALRDFVGVDLSRESVPDATTLLKFRRLLNENDLTRALFAEINAHLREQGLLMRVGTIVDATIIAAPSSTKNEKKQRDPDMHQAKKGPPRQNSCRLHRTKNPGAAMKDDSGSIRTIIQEQGGGAVAAAGERGAGGGGAGSRCWSGNPGALARGCAGEARPRAGLACGRPA